MRGGRKPKRQAAPTAGDETRSARSSPSSASLRGLVDAATAAVRARAPAGPDAAVRLVDDAADACPGLVVERYGPVVRLELYASRWPAELDALARAVAAASGAAHVVGLLRPRGGKAEMRVLVGDPPEGHVVHEDGLRFFVKARDPHAPGVGLFVDQRAGRRLVRGHARGHDVLNLFAHAGAFGVAAAAGGARRVDHVDAAGKCAPWAALNLALNGVDPRAHRFVVDDALGFLARAAKRGPRYGVVVVDPPTTALRPDGSRFHVEESLDDLARDALRTLVDGGALLLSTNDRALAVAEVAAAARRGAQRAGVNLASVVEVPLPPDVPSALDPQLRPMRGVWCVTEGATNAAAATTTARRG